MTAATIDAITRIVPPFGPVAGGTIVSIVGRGFQPGAAVTFGPASGTAFSLNKAGTLIQATTPAGAAGPATVTISNSGGTQATSLFIYTNATPGCGADCGNVGDPYNHRGAPPKEKPISACSEITSAGDYVVTKDLSGSIGRSDATCLHVADPSGPVKLDLGGHIVSGQIQFESNAAGFYRLLNGTVSCNADQQACIYWGVPDGRIHHLTVENTSLKPLANIDITAYTANTAAAPILQLDHITTTVAASAPDQHRTRNIMDDGASGSNPAIESIPIEANDNLITCSNDASACQGVELYDAPYSYVHNNRIILPAVCATCTDSARGILFDQYSNNGVAANNYILVNSNRGVRVRATKNIGVYGNTFTSISGQGRLAAVHIGETNGGIDHDSVSVYNNAFQLGPNGSGVSSSAAAGVYVYDNTVTCLGGDCLRAGPFAKTDVPDTVPADQSGGSIEVINNQVEALDKAGVAAVHICGPTGNGSFDCGGSPIAQTSGIVCNSGAVAPTGRGRITRLRPPCPPPPAAPQARYLLRFRRP